MEAPLSNRYAEMAELSKKYNPMYYTSIVRCTIIEESRFTGLLSTIVLRELHANPARIGDSCAQPLILV